MFYPEMKTGCSIPLVKLKGLKFSFIFNITITNVLTNDETGTMPNRGGYSRMIR